jgi:hypothetical protein
MRLLTLVIPFFLSVLANAEPPQVAGRFSCVSVDTKGAPTTPTERAFLEVEKSKNGVRYNFAGGATAPKSAWTPLECSNKSEKRVDPKGGGNVGKWTCTPTKIEFELFVTDPHLDFHSIVTIGLSTLIKNEILYYTVNNTKTGKQHTFERATFRCTRIENKI